MLKGNLLQKIIYKYARKSAVEQMTPGNNLGMDRIIEDHIERYNFVIKYTQNKSVLDISCGEGYGSAMMATSAKSVVGVDLLKDVVNEASKKYAEHKNLSFIQSDCVDYLKNNTFQYDVIISFETIEHINNYVEFLKYAKKRLKPGGIMVISTPNIKLSLMFAGDVFNPYHLHEFYTDELSDIITEVFNKKPILYRQRPINKKMMLLSSIWEFLVNKKSHIVKSNDNISGMDNIFVIKT